MAQDFEIVSVESLPLDMSAREEIYTDHNNRQCALLRIATQNIAPNQRELFNFVPDYGSEVVQRATRDGEIWLWVSPGLKYLRVKHRDWGQYELRLINHVARVESLHTYKIIIKGTMVLALQEQNNNSPTQQYLVFQLSPTNAMLEVDGQLWEVAPDGTAMKFVNFGTYSYRVQAPNYLPQTGMITVDDPVNTKIETVRLKSDLVQVTFQVDADAEIWINNEKKGTRIWTGDLGKGTYKIECKQANHETITVSQVVTASTDGETITLPTPIPIYGSLNVESTPIGATIYIDGKEVGKTPRSINEILIGQHEVKLVKEGYDDYAETAHIRKGERGQINAKLIVKHEKLITDDLSANDIEEHNVPEGAINGLFSVSPTKHVWFSKGNLQYQASTNSWRFAENQWEIIGFYNKYISSSYSGYIDLFGWGTSGWNCGNSYYKPWCYYETEGEKYGPKGANNLTGKYSKSDWGLNNKIVNGGNIIGQWRTLEEAEWKYLLFDRNTASGIRFARAMVNNGSSSVFGIILLPDDWDETIYALHKTNVDREPFNNDYNTSSLGPRGDGANMITYADWINLFEANGAVFLPAAGYRIGKSFGGNYRMGVYWSASDYDGIHAYGFSFSEDFFQVSHGDGRFYGLSVRLVQDYKSSKK